MHPRPAHAAAGVTVTHLETGAELPSPPDTSGEHVHRNPGRDCPVEALVVATK